jgi:serine protease Do
MRVQTVDQGIAQYYKLKNPKGAIVTGIEKGSPADDAGIKTEDVIIGINSEAVNAEEDFWGVITDANIGDKITVKILRNGDEMEKSFTLKVK